MKNLFGLDYDKFDLGEIHLIPSLDIYEHKHWSESHRHLHILFVWINFYFEIRVGNDEEIYEEAEE